jgi:ribosome-binding protein aMBF1 (putative translation factor)
MPLGGAGLNQPKVKSLMVLIVRGLKVLLQATIITMTDEKQKSNSFGEAVRKARTAIGLTQEELADRSGLDRSYIGGVERGERNPTLTVIEKIAKGLGLTLAELFSYSTKGPKA